MYTKRWPLNLDGGEVRDVEHSYAGTPEDGHNTKPVANDKSDDHASLLLQALQVLASWHPRPA